MEQSAESQLAAGKAAHREEVLLSMRDRGHRGTATFRLRYAVSGRNVAEKMKFQNKQGKAPRDIP